MAKFFNCSDNFLWQKGVKPILPVIYIGLIGYLLILIFHKPITELNNQILTLVWMAITFYLLLYWIKRLDKTADPIWSWTQGLVSEMIVNQKLKKLPDDYYVFYDVRIPDMGGNIDFIVACKYGVFAIEVKSRQKQYEYLSSIKHKSGCLQKYLHSQLPNINYVHPVLIYALGYNCDDCDDVIVLGKNDSIIKGFEKNLPASENLLLNSDILSDITNIINNKSN